MDPRLRLLEGNAVEVAPLLLGWTIATDFERSRTSVRITEVEAYRGATDPASHAFRGRTVRNAPMFMGPGIIYVYLVYGVHHCANIVTGMEGDPQAILLRAGQPVAGAAEMARRRGRSRNLTDGPGKLAQALGLTTRQSGLPIDGTRIALEPGDPPASVLSTPRIGISQGTELRWRFVARS